jgi:hypothetical protein
MLIACAQPNSPPPVWVAPTSALVPVDAAPAQADAGDLFDQFLTAMNGFADRMCSCPDASCATNLASEMKQWTVEFAKTATHDEAQLTPRQKQQAHDVAMRLRDCTRAATGAGSGAP